MSELPVRRRRIAAAALGALLGLVAAGALHALLDRGPAPVLEFSATDVEGAREGLQRARREAREEARSQERTLVLPRLDEETVRRIMPLTGDRRVYDPFCYFVYLPSYPQRMGFAEHPEKVWARRVNSLGLRDSEEWREAADARVLVAGDSHIDGVCLEEETLPARLEARLDRPGRSCQVMNASHGAYTFQHYLGVLERFLDRGLVPDLFVVVVYGGNDFAAGVQLDALFEDRPLPLPDPAREERRRLALERWPGEMGQLGNALELFASEPRAVDPALSLAGRATLEIQRRCLVEGVELLVVYLPPAAEAPASSTRRIGRMLTELGRTREDLERVLALGERYVSFLARRGIPHVDLRPAFRAAEEPLYWRSDLHLAPRGHELAAEVVLPLVEELLARR